MSGNRFDFLELAGVSPVTVQRPGDAAADITADPGDAEVGRRVDEDGRPLAQVVDTEVRGYRAWLEQMPAEQSLADMYETGVVNEASEQTAEIQHEVAYEMRPVELFGERGTQAGKFNYPTGIAVDSQGVVFVADSYNHRVQRVTPDGGVAVIGGRGVANTQFLCPQGVAVDAYDSFYIVEQGNNRVQKYTRNGALVLVIDRPGRLDGELDRPTGIAVTPSGDIYIADAGNCRVQLFNREGVFVRTVGANTGFGSLTTPQAVAVDGEEFVYVLDTFGHRIVRYDALGRFAGQVGGSRFRRNPQDNKPRFIEPRAIVADPAGLIYVADTGDTLPDGNPSRGRLQVMDKATGEVLLAIDRLGRNLGSLFRSGGLAIAPPTAPGAVRPGETPRGDLYVADTMNHRILRFAWNRR